MRRSARLFILAASCSVLTGCGSLGAPFGYPRLWDFTRSQPAEPSLAGSYRILQVRGESLDAPPDLLQPYRNRRDTTLTLNSDHTAVISNLPDFDGFGEKLICGFSGRAKWNLSGIDEWVIRLEDAVPATSPEAKSGRCGSDWEGQVYLLGQKPPYRLWLTIGDPDNDTGIEFELAGH